MTIIAADHDRNFADLHIFNDFAELLAFFIVGDLEIGQDRSLVGQISNSALHREKFSFLEIFCYFRFGDFKG